MRRQWRFRAVESAGLVFAYFCITQMCTLCWQKYFHNDERPVFRQAARRFGAQRD
jgi:hypothetical protein